MNLVFNPEGDDRVESREAWNGNSTNLMQLNNIKYLWAAKLYKQMREQFWIPEKLDLTQDITDYHNLTKEERKAFDGILSYLVFLDSIQTFNLPFIKNKVTAPEISLCLTEQASQEALHSQSYQIILEAIVPGDRRNEIYDFWRTDSVLKKRCKFIADYYQDYIDNPSSDENYFISLIANYLLESIYFFNGFCFFYSLANRQLMSGSADVFRLINRDELSHIRLFRKLILEAKNNFKYSEDKIYEMFVEAVNQECLWTDHIIGDNILGITSESTRQYTQYLANIRLKAIGFTPIYTGAINPYQHLERFADTSSEASTKGNFFEASVTSYVMSSGVSGWEDF